MRLSVLALALLPAAGMAQAAPKAPAIRLINQPVAKTTTTLGSIGGVRQLPDGHVLINDRQKQQVLLYDSTLTAASVAADSTTGSRTATTTYGLRAGAMVPYFGDSTLFIDGATVSMLVIDPQGKVARTASVPRAQDVGPMTNPGFGPPGLDAKGRLVYRGAPNMRVQIINGQPNMQMPDTAPVLRVDLTTRKVDTLAYFKVLTPKIAINRSDDGRITPSVEINPLPMLDDWAVLADGSVALIRGREYRIDWLKEDGTLEHSARIPFPWQRMTDEDKIKFIDSAKVLMAKAQAGDEAGASALARAMGMGGFGGGDMGGGRMMIMGGAPGAAAKVGAEAAAGAGRGEVRVEGGRAGGDGKAAGPGGPGGAPNMNFVSPSELPDYRPPFVPGGARGDADGNLWIQTTIEHGVALGPVYDVINRKGELVDRIQLPAGRTVVGFGKGGVVYMAARDGANWRVEKARTK